MNTENVHTQYTNGTLLSLKKDVILSFVALWLNVESIMSSEINQAQKCKYHMVSVLHELQIIDLMEIESIIVLIRDSGEWKARLEKTGLMRAFTVRWVRRLRRYCYPDFNITYITYEWKFHVIH